LFWNHNADKNVNRYLASEKIGGVERDEPLRALISKDQNLWVVFEATSAAMDTEATSAAMDTEADFGHV
jgi:hypothetical protein